MKTFSPKLHILPPPQFRLWQELDTTPSQFVLYGGTALALHLGHRTSVDFDFFSTQPFDPHFLADHIPYLKDAEHVQIAPNTLTCRVERNGPVLVSFFGGLDLASTAPPERPEGRQIAVASLLDIAGTKAAVIQKRAEKKDYLDIDALLQSGMSLTQILQAAIDVYGDRFNPLITLKALSFYDDIPDLSREVRKRLRHAVDSVDPLIFPIARQNKT